VRIVSNYLTRQLSILRRDESGQTAFLMLLAMPMVFLFYALAIDSGIWFLDHRTAQNQADAAALAAIQDLPAADTTEATATVEKWLTKNGSGPGDLECLEYSDIIADGQWDSVRVCVGRESPGIFSSLLGVSFVHVSAVGGARTGSASSGNVKPWAIAPEDPDCGNPEELCQADMDGDGDLDDCGFYPPIPEGDPLAYLGLCPWGLHADRLHKFKVSDKYTPGNFAPIEACGKGGAKIYKDCIIGKATSGFYSVGDTVWVEIQTGNIVGPTESGVDEKYSYEATIPPGLLLSTGKYEDTLECDVLSTPDPITGLDPDGKAAAVVAWVDDPLPRCDFRLISIVVIDHFPDGGGNALVLGIATFGIARWDRSSPSGDAMGNNATSPKQSCGQASTVKSGGDGGYECGQIWGYFMQDAIPPDALLGKMGDADSPFAPRVYALTE